MTYQKPFDKTEYSDRVAAVKVRMQQAGFDLIICQDPANMCYLSGFDGWSFYTPQCLLVHVDEDMPIWFGRAQDAKSANITTELQAGMRFHFQSGVWLEKFGAAVSEPFVVTENGGERLCDVYRGLIVID